MKKKQIILLATSLAILLIGGYAYLNHKYPFNRETTLTKLTFNKSDVTFVQTLKDSNGTILGDLNVLDLNRENKTFSALFVSKLVDGKNIIIYQVDANGFSSNLGQDSPGAGRERFSGLKFVSVGVDNFTLSILTDNGKGISDDQIIRWNKKKKVFELFRPDFDNPIYTKDVPVGTLKDSTGAVLGELSVVHSDVDKNVLKALFIGSTTPNKSSDLYRIIEEGFFNTNGQEQEILGPNFYGFELVGIKGDHFTVRILYQNGKIKSDNITIGWDENKQIFKVIDPNEK